MIAISIAMGGVFSSHKAYYAAGNSFWVPYNVKTGSWATGLHTVTGFFEETLSIHFWEEGEKYATENLELADGMWTGMVENLLTTPSIFRSGTLLTIYSADGFFTVTQVTMSPNGYTSQIFYAYPGAFMASTTLSNQPSSISQDIMEGPGVTPPAK